MIMRIFYDINRRHILPSELFHSTSFWHNCYLLASHACHTVNICTNYESKVYIDFTSRHITLVDRESLNGDFILYFISYLEPIKTNEEKSEQTRFTVIDTMTSTDRKQRWWYILILASKIISMHSCRVIYNFYSLKCKAGFHIENNTIAIAFNLLYKTYTTIHFSVRISNGINKHNGGSMIQMNVDTTVSSFGWLFWSFNGQCNMGVVSMDYI